MARKKQSLKNIVFDIYRELYENSEPKADFDFLVENAEIMSDGRKYIPYNDYEIDGDLMDEMVEDFRNGISLNDGECKSSILEIIDKRSCYVTLTEGRYHQIKRMFGCYGLDVLELKRVRIGNLDLPSDLEIGESRELTDDELKKITE